MRGRIRPRLFAGWQQDRCGTAGGPSRWAPTRVVLVIVDLATGESTEIPGTSYPYDLYDIGHPRWSPDGTRIAFHVVEGPPTERGMLIFPEPTSPGPSSIYVVGTDGSGLRQLTPDGVAAGDPDWSPDGSFIVFGPTSLHLWLYGQNQHEWRIQAIRPDGSDLHVVVPPDAATPSWTGGGAQILFTQSEGKRQLIRIADRDGSDIRDVASSPSPARSRCTRSSSPCPERLRRIPRGNSPQPSRPTLVRRAQERRSTCSNCRAWPIAGGRRDGRRARNTGVRRPCIRCRERPS